MKSPKTVVIVVVAVLMVAAVYFLVIKPRGAPQAQETVPTETVPEGLDLTGLQNNIGGQSAPAENISTQQIQSTGWCMNYTGEAAYPDGARFYSAYAEEWLVCRVAKGGFEKEDGRIVAAQILTTQPTVGFAPWDGVTYAP